MMWEDMQLSEIPWEERMDYTAEFNALAREIARWKLDTFGKPKLGAFLARASKEVTEFLLELEQGRYVSEELADVFIVYLGSETVHSALHPVLNTEILFSTPTTQDTYSYAARLFVYAAEAYDAGVQGCTSVNTCLTLIFNMTFVLARQLNINLLDAVRRKFEKNKARVWSINDGLAQHVAEGHGYE